MKNNRGLTLIELIAVLGVIALVALIAIPTIHDQIEKGREQMYNEQISTIIDAARSWATDHVDELPNTIGDEINVSMEQLQFNGYLDLDFKNVKTKEPFTPTSYVQIRCTVATDINYDYTYTYIP